MEIEYSLKYNSFISSLRCNPFFSFLAVMEPDIDNDMDDETEYDLIKEVPKLIQRPILVKIILTSFTVEKL